MINVVWYITATTYLSRISDRISYLTFYMDPNSLTVKVTHSSGMTETTYPAKQFHISKDQNSSPYLSLQLCNFRTVNMCAPTTNKG
jgi:hypothetical protein